MTFQRLTFACVAMLALPLSASAQLAPTYLNFESGHVRPLAMSPNDMQLFAVNTPDNFLEIFDVDGSGNLTHSASVPVGMRPVAVAARSNTEVWVVNHLSDSVSIVDLSGTPRVTRTLLVGDEPRDIVFAGASGERAFITTAHRGQNSPFPRSEYDTASVGRADVWVFDATSPATLGSGLGGDALTVITLFGDKPRALTASADGTQVFAAVMNSGNQTTAVNEGFVCDTSGSNITNDIVQGSCNVQGSSMPGGVPLPHKNHEGIARPETGLILKWNRDGGTSNEWQDELDRNWNNAVKFSLPDRDVFEIDADQNPAPTEASFYTGVGTTIFNMIQNPMRDVVYVTNTDAQNHVRFEGPGTLAAGFKPGGEPASVVGNLAQARMTVIDNQPVTPTVSVVHLNSHLTYGSFPVPSADKAKSLATPLGMAISSDGATLYVAAFGSDKIAVLTTADLEGGSFVPDSNDHFTVAGGGPSGLILNGSKLYVSTRFDNAVAVLDSGTGVESTRFLLHDREPDRVVEGRRFLYDAQLTGSNGESSCSSCHIFGDMDDLAWDLGNPDDDEVDNTNSFPVIGPPNPVFHPMKGPMTTQSLRGLDNMGPQHWRGDRQGDENAAFNAFNVAFPGLVGRDEGQLTTEQMQTFTDFALEIRYPPNPIRQLDGALRADEMAGAALYGGRITDTVANCNGCHVLDPSQGFFGGDTGSSLEGETQEFKVPHLRNMYQKIGMFGMADLGVTGGSFASMGNQIRGFGFLHDGSFDTAERFVSSSVFSVNTTEEENLEAFMVAFPTDLAAIVGQQITLTSTNSGVAGPRITLLIDQAETPFTSKILGTNPNECDLIAKTISGSNEKGYLLQGDGLFHPDDGGAAIDDTTLRSHASTAGQEVTYTCVPPGSGHRLALDRDEDLLDNGVETGTGVFVDALDTGTSPSNEDTDGDGWRDGIEVLAGTDPNDNLDFPAMGVPALGAIGLVLLSLGLLGTGAWWRLSRRVPA